MTPGLLVKDPFSLITAPETLSPMEGRRLWWAPVTPLPWVVRVVFVVVVVVTVPVGRVLRLVRVLLRLPVRRCIRVGLRVVVWLLRVVGIVKKV